MTRPFALRAGVGKLPAVALAAPHTRYQVVIEINGNDETIRRNAVADVAVLPVGHRYVLRVSALRSRAHIGTVVARIATHCTEKRMIERCGSGECIRRRNTMTQHAFRPRRTRQMVCGQFAGVATRTARGHASVIERAAGERGRAVTIAAILPRRGRRMIGRLARRTERNKRTAVTSIATQTRDVAVIEQCRLGPRLG